MRQYIPAFYKACTLHKVPAFHNVFCYDESWLNPTKPFFDFYELIQSLKPGLYLSKASYPKYTYLLSVCEDTNKILFTVFKFKNLCCRLKSCSLVRLNKRDVHLTIPLSDCTNFFTDFLSNHEYFDDETISVYKYYTSGYFYVNHSTNMIHWIDGRYYEFKENECFIEDPCKYKYHFKLVLNVNRSIDLSCLAWYHRYGHVRCMWCICKQKTTCFEPLNSKTIYEKEMQNPNSLELEFQITGDMHTLIKGQISRYACFNTKTNI